MSIEPRTAAALAESALTAVFAPAMVSGLRQDSPLAAVGLTPADLVCLSDAVAEAAHGRLLTCVLDDDDLDGVETVADLVAAIATRAQPVEAVVEP